MKVVVTGANGFLGSWVVKGLAATGVDVHALVRPTSDLSELEGARYKILHGDVTDLESLRKSFHGADTVFHLAGVIAYRRSQRAAMERVNVEGTRNIIEACRENKVRRLVHLSSVTAIGAGFSPQQVLDENSPYNVAHLHLGYFDTKKDAEVLVKEACKRGDVDAVILNPSTIYGFGDARKGSRSNQIKVAQGRMKFYTSGGVSVVAAEDAVAGILSAWQKGRTGERYILSGENILIRDLFAMIADVAGQKAPSIQMPSPVLFTLGFLGDLGDRVGWSKLPSMENAWTATMYHWFKNDKARRELGFQPRPARQAIENSVAWMKEAGLLNQP